MKKIIVILAAFALIFSGCRKKADYHPYIGESSQLAYDSYSSQFEFIWKCLSTGYVFWDVDKTDWDAVYDNYMPKFLNLDDKHAAGQDVTLNDLEELYQGAMGGMQDHHMNIVIKNIHPSPNDILSYLMVRPGMMEVEKRDYCIESLYEAQTHIAEFLNNEMDSFYDLTVHESATAYVSEIDDSVTYHYCLFNLPDGRKIPYLWQSMAAITPVMRTLGTSSPASAAADVVDHWLTAIKNTPREQLAGIILDNRTNTGGYQDDLDYLIGSFLNERTEILKTRYKEGPGRLEHSVWTPYYIDPFSKYHRDITAENIPYVVLCDIYSISMGEIEPMTIKAVLPTSHTIGERTFGATGPLQPNTSIDLNYGGPFGNINTMNHYVYTSSFESSIGGTVYEGIGLTPDQIVLRKNHNGNFKAQLNAAIEYITLWQ